MLTAHLHLKGITVENYTWTMITQLFVELLCMAKTNLDDPHVIPRSNQGQQVRSFVVLDTGELDGHQGYWVEEDETMMEGFLDEVDDDFWVFDGSTWVVRRFRARLF